MLYREFSVALGIPKEDVTLKRMLKSLKVPDHKQAVISEESERSWI